MTTAWACPAAGGAGGGFGLAGMRGRVREAGGVLDVTQRPRRRHDR